GTGSSEGSGGSPETNVPPAIGPGRLRRLTRSQLENSLAFLLGASQVPKTEPDSLKDGFTSVGATYIITTDNGVEQYHTALKTVVKDAFADTARRATITSCTPSSVTDETCVRTFAQAFG